ncbi:hypothetical protein [Asticcacaulis endophyticus]|uniref:Uncharacterized protein n=1 Tax=Asticcacaulis endophyticus TaxID=1395890 RepID=A0A918Q4X4_9CAUL|nr:hypothetical protein [Asticcacaulis endophyticus]GGZ31908.1 hypothetical protein GCM10011273_17400 [Asticcacaulis endophyticus]
MSDEPAKISLIWDSDETFVGNLEGLTLSHVPKTGDEIFIVATGNSEPQGLIVTRIRHTLVFEFMGSQSAPFHQIDVFVKPIKT